MRAVAIVLAALVACDSAVKVGEPKAAETEAGPPTVPIVPGADAGDAGSLVFSWRQHAPIVPCTIYAMAERAANDVYLGCRGGRIYRFDGVNAKLELDIDDDEPLFSLIWIAPNGEVWAGAQTEYDDYAKTQLHHYDGTKWTKFGDATRRFVSLAGKSAPWVASETEIFALEGGALVSKYKATGGFFRGCAFAADDKGWCVGTNGLAVEWNGTAWTPIASKPWSADAEVFGVEADPFSKIPTFFYGEPISHPNGDHSCRVARLGSTYTAAYPCFPDFDVARKRTGVAVVGGKTHYLLAVSESPIHALVYDLGADSVSTLCGPVIAFASGSANTRAGGSYGLLSTIVGSGTNQLALSGFGGSTSSATDFKELAVASDGAAWARIEDTTSCGSITDRLVRFEKEEWQPVPGPQGALSGQGLAAASKDRAYTIDVFTDRLLVSAPTGWNDGPVVEEGFSIFAVAENDVWIGGRKEGFGHFDGTTYTQTQPSNRLRQSEQIVAVGSDVWIVQQGQVSGDTDLHLVHWNGTDLTEENLGIQRLGANVRVSALPKDPKHVYCSGHPAKAWDGAKWNDLPFDANDVWARSPEEVFFTDRGDIWKWDGAKRTRVHHGFIPITAISGSKDRAFAVGPGGLTLEFAAWPDEQR
jgi:hypothetical protein